MLKAMIVAVVLAAPFAASADPVPAPADQGFIDPLPRPMSDMEQERGRQTGIKCPYMGT